MSALEGQPAPQDLIFVHIQKTGGSSISQALGHPVHPPYKHWFAPQLRDMVGAEAWDRAITFTFVRNPWDRLVSWWTMVDQVRRMQRPGVRLNNFFAYVLANASTFDDFIRKCHADIEDRDGRKCILRNQIDYVVDANGQEMVDFIGRFENLDSDFRKLAELSRRPLPALEHRNRSAHRPYQVFYTPETRDLVARAYQRDIARFGYSFES